MFGWDKASTADLLITSIIKDIKEYVIAYNTIRTLRVSQLDIALCDAC